MLEEGLDALTELADFDAAEIKTLCQAVRKPGGTIVDPNDNTRVIQNPGHNIPSICEGRLILACYGASLYQYIGRDIDPLMLSRNRLKEFKKHKEGVKNHEDPDKFPELSKSFTIMKMLDQFPTYLREKHGVQGIALSYVIREDPDVPVALPPLMANVPWSDDRTSMMEELIDYAPHTGPSYSQDNATVYRLLQEILGSTIHMSSITRHQRSRNGRGAYLDLVLHNMGNSKWEKTIEAAEKAVTIDKWDGKNARYPLKFHVQKHREAFNHMMRAAQYIEYVPPNESTRVRRLLKSITCSALESTKDVISNDTAKKGDFELMADYMLERSEEKSIKSKTHQVSALHHKRKHGKKGESGSTGVENRFYKPEEFGRLSADQKQELFKMRGTSRSNKMPKTSSSKISALETKLEEQAQIIASLQSAAAPAAPLPPPPAPGAQQPLQPPTGFAQRGQRN